MERFDVKKKTSYEKPVLARVDKMVFPREILESQGKRIVCKQCSSCHGCR